MLRTRQYYKIYFVIKMFLRQALKALGVEALLMYLVDDWLLRIYIYLFKYRLKKNTLY